MNRREFGRSIAGIAAATAAGSVASAMPNAEAPQSKDAATAGVPFEPVMLWTVFRGEPFAQRLDKVAEAGYRAVELVDEFKGWTKEDFGAARRRNRNWASTSTQRQGFGTRWPMRMTATRFCRRFAISFRRCASWNARS